MMKRREALFFLVAGLALSESAEAQQRSIVPVRGVVERVGEPGPGGFVLVAEVGREAIPGHQVEGEAMHSRKNVLMTND